MTKRKPKLPNYDSRISLEEAIHQFDFATSELVLHPFNGSGENDIDARRDHVFQAAQNSYLAASRWYGVIEREIRGEQEESPRKNYKKYLEDISSCSQVLTNQVLPWYSRIEFEERRKLKGIQEEKDSEQYQAQDKKVKSIAREKALIQNYLTLMSMMRTFVRDELAKKTNE